MKINEIYHAGGASVTSPYIIETDFPHCLNISGGKSSGYMLRRIIDANNFDKDGWPDLIRPVFTNTGREMEQTYKFLHEMESQWNVPMVWIEMSQIHAVSYTHLRSPRDS